MTSDDRFDAARSLPPPDLIDRLVGWGRQGWTLARSSVFVGADFELRSESSLDRAAMALAEIDEPQALDARFDEQVFISGEDPRLIRALRSSRKARQIILSLMRQGVTRLRCERGLLHAPMARVSRTRSVNERAAAEGQLLHGPALDELARALLEAVPELSRWQAEPARLAWRRSLWMTLASLLASAAMGLHGLLSLIGAPRDWLMGSRPWGWMILFGAIILSAHLGWAWRALKGSSRWPSALGSAAFAGLISALVGSFWLAYLVDTRLPSGSPAVSWIAEGHPIDRSAASRGPRWTLSIEPPRTAQLAGSGIDQARLSWHPISAGSFWALGMAREAQNDQGRSFFHVRMQRGALGGSLLREVRACPNQDCVAR